MQESLVLEGVCVSCCMEHIKNEIGVCCKKKHVKALVLWKLFKHVLLNFFKKKIT